MNVPDSPRPSQAGEKGPSAALAFLGGGHAPLPNLPPKLARAQPALERRMRSLVVATYIQVRLTPRFLLPAGRHGAALHLDLFEQPALTLAAASPQPSASACGMANFKSQITQ